MTDKIETGASSDAPEVAEISQAAPADENNSGADEAAATGDLVAIVDLVIEKLGPALAEAIKAACEAEAAAAFDRIIRDPDTAKQAREAAIEAARAAQEQSDAEAAKLSKAASEQAEQDAADAAAALRDAEEKAEADYTKAKTSLRATIEGVGFFEHGEDEALLRFGNGSTFLVGHDRVVTLAQFAISGARATFKPVHDFNRAAPGGLAREAWLVIKRPGKKSAALVADLGPGLPIGGGAASRLPAESLAF